METANGTALPLGDKGELPAKVPSKRVAKVPPKRVAKKGRPIVTPPWSVPEINSHIPSPMATFPNPNKQTETEKPTSNQASSTPEQSSMPLEQQAVFVKRAFIPAALATILSMKSVVGAPGYRVCLDNMIQESGNPTDPLEIMLLEQTFICHLCSMQMQVQAYETQGTEASEMYMLIACRLSAEFRKTVLVLKEFRRK